MRTTVTLDKDVERLLREAMHRTRRSFKETLNAAIRSGLTAKSARMRSSPFVLKARDLRLRPGIDPNGFNKLVDDLEAEAVIGKPRRRP